MGYCFCLVSLVEVVFVCSAVGEWTTCRIQLFKVLRFSFQPYYFHVNNRPFGSLNLRLNILPKHLSQKLLEDYPHCRIKEAEITETIFKQRCIKNLPWWNAVFFLYS